MAPYNDDDAFNQLTEDWDNQPDAYEVPAAPATGPYGGRVQQVKPGLTPRGKAILAVGAAVLAGGGILGYQSYSADAAEAQVKAQELALKERSIALEEMKDLKWREGDGPFIHFHAQTTDRIALFASNGRVYTLAGDKLPGARGFGEPVRLFIDLAAEVDIVQLMTVRPELKLLIASSDGKGFVTSGDSTIAETRKGKQLVNLRTDASVAIVRVVPEGADSVAVIGENRKMLLFPLAELPELGRGQGVTLQRYRDGGLADAIAIRFADGLSWALGGESGRVRTESDLTPWRAARGAAGRMPPIGFPRDNKFADVSKAAESTR